MNRNVQATTAPYSGSSTSASHTNGVCAVLVQSLYTTNERLLNIEDRLRTLADRLFSVRPEAARDSEDSPCGSVNLLVWNLTWVERTIDGVVSQIERLEQL